MLKVSLEVLRGPSNYKRLHGLKMQKDSGAHHRLCLRKRLNSSSLPNVLTSCARKE